MINISANISRELGMIPGGEFRRAVVEVFNYYRFLLIFHIKMFFKKIPSNASFINL